MLLKLMNQFLIISILTIILTTISVFVFSCYYRTTYKMKRATEKISKLNKPIQLGIKRNDELGSLAKRLKIYPVNLRI